MRSPVRPLLVFDTGCRTTRKREPAGVNLHKIIASHPPTARASLMVLRPAVHPFKCTKSQESESPCDDSATVSQEAMLYVSTISGCPVPAINRAHPGCVSEGWTARTRSCSRCGKERNEGSASHNPSTAKRSCSAGRRSVRDCVGDDGWPHFGRIGLSAWWS